MTHEDRAQFAEALRFALEAHGDRKRRGTRIPYVSHLLQVAGLVLEHGGDVEQAIAGLLHGLANDRDAELGSTLGECFGPEVERIARSCSDVAETDSTLSDFHRHPRAAAAWEARKQDYLDHLRASDERVKLVAACDKLDNLRSLVADLHAEGGAALARFHGTPAQVGWYYQELRQALGPELPRRLLRELDARSGELAGFIPLPQGEGAPTRPARPPVPPAVEGRTRRPRASTDGGRLPRTRPPDTSR